MSANPPPPRGKRHVRIYTIRLQTTSLAARAAIKACRRSYKAFCAGRRKALETFARAPDRQHVVYTTTPDDYVPLLSPTIDPRAISTAWRATAIVVFARRNCDGSITRCIAPLFYRNAGQLLGDLASSDEVAGATFRHWFALSSCAVRLSPITFCPIGGPNERRPCN